MVVFVNDPKRTVISISVPRGEAGAAHFAGLLADYGLAYASVEAKKNRTIFRDISGSLANMSGLINRMEDIEWDNPERFYILVGGRRKGGKKYEHGAEDRGEVREGSEGGNPEAADSYPGYGEADPVGGNCDPVDDPGAGTDQGPEEVAGTYDGCDQ